MPLLDFPYKVLEPEGQEEWEDLKRDSEESPELMEALCPIQNLKIGKI